MRRPFIICMDPETTPSGLVGSRFIASIHVSRKYGWRNNMSRNDDAFVGNVTTIKRARARVCFLDLCRTPFHKNGDHSTTAELLGEWSRDPLKYHGMCARHLRRDALKITHPSSRQILLSDDNENIPRRRGHPFG